MCSLMCVSSSSMLDFGLRGSVIPFLRMPCWVSDRALSAILVWFFFFSELLCYFLYRKRLFNLINELPTLFEAVTEVKPNKEKPNMDIGSKSRNGTKVKNLSLCPNVFLNDASWNIKPSRTPLLHPLYILMFDLQRPPEGPGRSMPKLCSNSYGGGEEEEEVHGKTLCGSCGQGYNEDEFWIGCDICERWYHGKCVKITPAKAESIEQYKCPSCNSKRSRQWPCGGCLRDRLVTQNPSCYGFGFWLSFWSIDEKVNLKLRLVGPLFPRFEHTNS